MVKAFEQFLGRFSWRAKILGLAAIFALGTLAVGAMGAYSIINLSEDVKVQNAKSTERTQIIEEAQFALLRMGTAQAEVIARVDVTEIKKAAVTAIRAAADLEEKLHNLHQVLPDDPKVVELQRLVQELKPRRMQVITLARRDRDDEALGALEVMVPVFNRVDELADTIIAEQRLATKQYLVDIEKKGTQTVYVLMVFVGIGFIVSILLSLVLARFAVKPMFLLERAMAALATGDLQVKLTEAGPISHFPVTEPMLPVPSSASRPVKPVIRSGLRMAMANRCRPQKICVVICVILNATSPNIHRLSLLTPAAVARPLWGHVMPIQTEVPA
jgi:methyl-accepting chemotaxis protein